MSIMNQHRWEPGDVLDPRVIEQINTEIAELVWVHRTEVDKISVVLKPSSTEERSNKYGHHFTNQAADRLRSELTSAGFVEESEMHLGFATYIRYYVMTGNNIPFRIEVHYHKSREDRIEQLKRELAELEAQQG